MGGARTGDLSEEKKGLTWGGGLGRHSDTYSNKGRNAKVIGKENKKEVWWRIRMHLRKFQRKDKARERVMEG